MAVNEDLPVDHRGVYIEALFTLAKDDPRKTPYVEIEAERQQALRDAQAAAEAKAAQRARAATAARKKRPGQKRPWQSLGITSAEWRERQIAAGVVPPKRKRWTP